MKILIVVILAIIFTPISYATEPAYVSSECVQDDFTQEKNTKEIIPEIAGKYAVYAMMSENVYHKKENPPYGKYLKELGWKQVDKNGNETDSSVIGWCGFRYDIYDHEKTTDTVIAFRGTEGIGDFLCANFALVVSPQYKQARKEVSEFFHEHNRKVTLTGHSLGGGLALSASLLYGFDAVIFNPSPRVFDGRKNIHCRAKRTMIFDDHEILKYPRWLSPKFKKVMKGSDVYETDFTTGWGIQNHFIDNLTNGLITKGAEYNKELIPIRDKLKSYIHKKSQ